MKLTVPQFWQQNASMIIAAGSNQLNSEGNQFWYYAQVTGASRVVQCSPWYDETYDSIHPGKIKI